jgi:hypothetical protein
MKSHPSGVTRLNLELCDFELESSHRGMLIFQDFNLDPEVQSFPSDIIKRRDHCTNVSKTILESQLVDLTPKSKVKTPEKSIETKNLQFEEDECRPSPARTGPCFLNMIDPFRINHRQMKLLSTKLNKNEYGNLLRQDISLSHVR